MGNAPSMTSRNSAIKPQARNPRSGAENHGQP
jgi:hypothetical protein